MVLGSVLTGPYSGFDKAMVLRLSYRNILVVIVLVVLCLVLRLCSVNVFVWFFVVLV